MQQCSSAESANQKVKQNILSILDQDEREDHGFVFLLLLFRGIGEGGCERIML